MNTIEKIRAEIERLKGLYNPNDFYDQAYLESLADVESFLDTLEESDRPEPYNPVYDEAYLNEKIAKATKSWEGVDVDAMLDECRGRDNSEKPNNHLEHVPEIKETGTQGLDEAAELWIAGVFLAYSVPDTSVKELREIAEKSFIAGAKWAMGQGEVIEGTLGYGPHLQRPIIHLEGVPSFYDGHCQEVIVQIRKKDE